MRSPAALKRLPYMVVSLPVGVTAVRVVHSILEGESKGISHIA